MVAVIVAVAEVTGLLDVVRDEERLQAEVDRLGWWGPIAMLGLMTVFVALGLPGLLFVLPAAALFDAPVAIAIGITGGLTSSTIGVIAARRVARDVLRRRIPPWLLRWDQWLFDHGILGVVVLRVSTYMFAPADWLLGLSSLRWREILIGTVIGFTPTNIAYVLWGDDVFGWLFGPTGLMFLGGVAVVLTGVRLARRRGTADQ